jgi:tetratricopeptide (TPR) repeat protein
MSELNDELYARIQELCSKGDQLAESEKYSNALSEYYKAYELLPSPKENWDASTWILAAIGDVNFLMKDYEAALQNLINAMKCPDAIGNPFIHLRLGQCHFELGNFNLAADEFVRAYAIEGEELFQNEDIKYFKFLITKIETSKPKKPWWKF